MVNVVLVVPEVGLAVMVSAIRDQKPGEKFWESVVRRRREEDEAFSHLSRSALYIELGAFLLALVLTFLLLLTPVAFRWIPLIVSFFGGALATEAVYSLGA